jgi:hypothetical protein
MSCDVKRCNQPSVLVWYKYEVCEKHWQKHCDDSNWSLFNQFKIEQTPVFKKANKMKIKRHPVKPNRFVVVFNSDELKQLEHKAKERERDIVDMLKWFITRDLK